MFFALEPLRPSRSTNASGVNTLASLQLQQRCSYTEKYGKITSLITASMQNRPSLNHDATINFDTPNRQQGSLHDQGSEM